MRPVRQVSPKSGRRLKQFFCEALDWRCPMCGVKMRIGFQEPDAATFDHIIPRSRGGKNIIRNLITVCHRCNKKRGSAPFPSALMPLTVAAQRKAERALIDSYPPGAYVRILADSKR